MCRCKACDEVMQDTEIIWRTHLNVWEDLCRRCRAIVDVYEINFQSKMDKLRGNTPEPPEVDTDDYPYI